MEKVWIVLQVQTDCNGCISFVHTDTYECKEDAKEKFDCIVRDFVVTEEEAPDFYDMGDYYFKAAFNGKEILLRCYEENVNRDEN